MVNRVFQNKTEQDLCLDCRQSHAASPELLSLTMLRTFAWPSFAGMLANCLDNKKEVIVNLSMEWGMGA